MSILQAFSIKNIFYDKMNLRLYFCVKIYSTPKCLTWHTNQRVTSFELRVITFTGCVFCTGNELRVTVYCTSYELPFTYELQVTFYCTSYKLPFACELRVTAYCTNYELPFPCELWVTVYCTSYFFKGFFVTLSLTYF